MRFIALYGVSSSVYNKPFYINRKLIIEAFVSCTKGAYILWYVNSQKSVICTQYA